MTYPEMRKKKAVGIIVAVEAEAGFKATHRPG
jgi:hypothetical protein